MIDDPPATDDEPPWPAWVPYPSTRRHEDHRLVRGEGRFVANLTPEGCLHAGFVRSVVARGRIRSVDVSTARQHPGVVAVFTAADLDLGDITSGVEGVPMNRPILARDLVNHIGEPIALIVGDDRHAVADAVELIDVEIEELAAVVGGDTALESEPIHPEADSNLVTSTTVGDPTAGWDDPAIEVVVDLSVVNQRLAPVTLEPLAILAVPDSGFEGTRVQVGHQAPHLLKRQLSQWFGDNVEVTVPDVGGGYGLKARLYPEYVAVVAAARRLGRPVQWLQSRSEQLLCGCHGRDMMHRIRIGGSGDGRIRRADVDFTLDVGAYPHLGTMVADFTRLVSPQLYDIAEFSVTSRVVVTNTAPIAPYRGAGRPEAAYAMERAVDAFARQVDLDPVTVRARNLLSPSSWPHRTATGARYDSGDYRAALDRAVAMLDVPAIRAEQAERLHRFGDPGSAAPRAETLIGVGIAAWVERAGGAPDTGEYARVEAGSNGRITVLSGSCDNGQGHETVWAQIAGRAFGFTPTSVNDRVTVIEGDTARIPRGSGSSASRSAQIGASAVHRCAHRLRLRLASIAASVLEAAPDDIVVDDGLFTVRGVPTVALDLGRVVDEAGRLGLSSTDEEWYVPGSQTFPYGVHGAVVEVEVETGRVTVNRYVAVDDCGVALNPDMVEAQTTGSVVQGIGQALFEQVVYSSEGQLLTGTLLDYGIPGSSDVPIIETDRIETPAPSNTLGAKGAGEGGCIGAPPAIVNAVLDALAPLGVDHLDMPLDPNTVWAAINAASPE